MARELTKHFETVLDGRLSDLHAQICADPNQQRGEFVLIVEGAPQGDDDAALVLGRRAYAILSEHLSPSQAARLAADISGIARKRLYLAGDAAAPDETAGD